ncbi:MAG: FAD-dependent oxidoreductase [Candidatus Aminicenantes bacterium]|nr:FAD-dependent oxidoreductase [Candidatus Aminicenantes bacterium]
MKNYATDILIVGAGPAGLTAAIYAARSGKKTLVLEGERAASRLALGYDLENYPGFPSINSNDLLARFREQAGGFGAEFVRGDTIALSLTTDPKYVSTTDSFIEAKAVILATGKPFAKERLIPGEERLLGYGVSYCAVCDGPLYKGRDVAAYGHSAEAVEDIWILEQTGVRVHWIPGRVKDPAALEEAFTKAEKIGIPVYGNAEIKEIAGDKNVERIILKSTAGERSLDVDAVFVFREVPTGPLFAKSGLAIDHKQCLAVDRFQRTNLEGVFAAGDLTCGGLQVVSAAGEGCVAALQALAYLRKSG